MDTRQAHKLSTLALQFFFLLTFWIFWVFSYITSILDLTEVISILNFSLFLQKDCRQYVMRCMIWYHLYNFKNVKNTHGGVLLLLKACNFTKSSTPPWVFFTFFTWYKWYQITQNILYIYYGVTDRESLLHYTKE